MPWWFKRRKRGEVKEKPQAEKGAAGKTIVDGYKCVPFTESQAKAMRMSTEARMNFQGLLKSGGIIIRRGKFWIVEDNIAANVARVVQKGDLENQLRSSFSLGNGEAKAVTKAIKAEAVERIIKDPSQSTLGVVGEVTEEVLKKLRGAKR
jgi:hypothetical protein